uniref:Uncharacterized protein n=1 Tax=Zonotrichia albicollis TaxID=44394 RepID=A0A8D2N2C5_ZONAL
TTPETGLALTNKKSLMIALLFAHFVVISCSVLVLGIPEAEREKPQQSKLLKIKAKVRARVSNTSRQQFKMGPIMQNHVLSYSLESPLGPGRLPGHLEGKPCASVQSSGCLGICCSFCKSSTSPNIFAYARKVYL